MVILLAEFVWEQHKKGDLQSPFSTVFVSPELPMTQQTFEETLSPPLESSVWHSVGRVHVGTTQERRPAESILLSFCDTRTPNGTAKF